MPETINGVTHPVNGDFVDFTGPGAGTGDLGVLAATAGANVAVAAGAAGAAALAAANAYTDQEVAAQSGTSVTVNDDGTATVEGSEASARVATVTPGKNLYNPADPDVIPGFYVNWNSGALMPGATYTATGFIPVTPGQTYALSGPRSAAFYTEDRTFIPGSGLNNSGEPPATMTAPAGAAWLRAAYFGTDFQVEAGTATTPYEPFNLGLASGLTAGVLADANSYTDAALAALPPIPAPPLAPALEQLRTLAGMASGDLAVAVVADSTANDDNDWVRIWAQKWGAGVPADVRRAYRSWNATTNMWRTEVIDAEGEPTVVGKAVDDTFTRTGDVFGSTPDVGDAWGGAAGTWVADGTHATPQVSGVISQTLASRDQTSAWTLTVVTTTPPVTQSFRLYAGARGAALGSSLWVNLTVNTSGVLTAQLFKTISGTNTTIVGIVAVEGQAYNSATPQTVTVTVEVAVQQVSATIVMNGQTTTLAGTITEADYAEFGGYCGIQSTLLEGAGPSRVRVNRVQMAAPSAVPNGRLTIHNGAVAGGYLPDAASRAAQFGALDVDVLILSIGHNAGAATSGPTFISQVSDWLDDWFTEHPESAAVIVSQNPQFPPAGSPSTHRDRQAALRLWATRHRYDYVPVFEAFTAEPDGGQSLVSVDGVHPTTPPGGALTGDYGAVLWADAFTVATS